MIINATLIGQLFTYILICYLTISFMRKRVPKGRLNILWTGLFLIFPLTAFFFFLLYHYFYSVKVIKYKA